VTVAVYTDSIFFEQRFLNRLKLPQYEIYHSQHEYIAARADIKIAFTTDRCMVDYDIGDPPRPPEIHDQQSKFPQGGFENKLAGLSRASNIVFTFDSEIHPFHIDIWNKCRHENVYWVAPGAANADSFINERIIYWPNFFNMQREFYQQVPEKLAEVNFNLPKPLYFDALLGRSRRHRDFVYNSIESSDIKDKIVMTYFGFKMQQLKPHKLVWEEDFIWEPGTNLLNDVVIGTHEPANYFGTTEGISRIIPVDLFNKTAYSIVAETNFDNRISFYTEKTAKPIIARRLFVVFSGYKFLENLRKQGYKTFNNVIDESYDLIEDNETRWAAAFEQVKRLCQLDQTEVFDKIKDTLEHNYNILVTANGDQQVADQIQEKLNKILT